jgi:hypothetical protein
VVGGKVHKTPAFYAVTPDRTILFLTMSIDRSLQNYDIKSDAIRALFE